MWKEMLLGSAILLCGTLHALNVRDFGAKGDGKTDDTKAIQRCVNAASRNVRNSAFAEVFFPAGTYRISDTIVVKNQTPSVHIQVSLRGENSRILGADPGKDLFYFEKSFRHSIDGLVFDGGKRQLKFWSNNIDTGRILLSNCVFQNASGCAVEEILLQTVYKDRSNRLAILQPCETSVSEDGSVRILWRDEEHSSPFFFTSQLTIIRDCRFSNNRKAVRLSADWAMMINCRMETSPLQEGAAIVSAGQLMLDNVTGTAFDNPEIPSQYWVQKLDGRNQTGVSFHKVKLRTDSGRGWAVLHNECRFGANQNAAYFFEDCEFQSAGSRENAVLFLKEIPNIIHMKNIREISGQPVNAVAFPEPPGENALDTVYYYATWDTDETRKSMPQDKRKFKFGIESNCRNIIDNLPGFMKNYSDEPLSPQLRKTWENFPKKILTSEKMNKRFRKQLTLDGFKGSPGTRLTEAVKTALHSPEPLEIVLPAGVYFLREPLLLPKEISLRGEGVASLVLSSRFPEGEPVFRCTDARCIQIRRIMLNNAYRNSIAELKTRPDTEAEILFAECSMERTKGGIRVVAGDGMPNLKNRTAVTVANSTFRCSQVLDSNAAFNTIDCVWVTSDFELFRKGSFVNRGNLYIRGMLGVPSLDNGAKYYYRRKTVRTGAVNDPRWIDNYGNLFIDRCRFGGEAKGMPAAVNYNPRAQILARESWLSSYGGNPGKRTLFYLETLPETIILEDMPGWPEYYSMTQWSAGKPFPGILFSSFCIPVRGDDGRIVPKAPGVE